ncbi:MAG: helix-turn-helix domain-containing protein [Desulfovibrionaceae bacterium]
MQKQMKPGRRYFLINVDEPYAPEVYEALKRGQMAKGEWPEGDVTFAEWVALTWPAPEGDDYEAAMARIHSVLGTRTQVQVAEALGVRQSSISDARRRNSIPDSWLLTILRRHWVNPEWIRTGQGARYLAEAER